MLTEYPVKWKSNNTFFKKLFTNTLHKINYK